MNPTIRSLIESDLDACAKAFAETFAAPPYNDEWSVRDARVKLAKLLGIDPDYAVCAEADGRIVGAVFGRVSYWWVGPCLVVEELFVHPAHQRRGVGRALMMEAQTRAKDRGVVGMWLLANRRSGALPFYERLGLSETPDVAVMLKRFPEV